MTSQKPERPRLRFTLRTLAIVVTLVCCYVACWGPTKRLLMLLRSSAIAMTPLVVTAEHGELIDVGDQQAMWVRLQVQRCYHVWLFGYAIELPFGRDVTSLQKVLFTR